MEYSFIFDGRKLSLKRVMFTILFCLVKLEDSRLKVKMYTDKRGLFTFIWSWWIIHDVPGT